MKKDKLKLWIKTIIFFIFILLIIFLVKNALSKYVMQSKEIHSQESTAFYFESDIADVTAKEYTINDWNGQTPQKLEFYVRNYTNSLLKSDEDISYTISAKVIDNTDDEIDNISLVNTYVQSLETNSTIVEDKLLQSEFKENQYILIIEPKSGVNIEPGTTFEIELSINSTSPYSKELISNITVKVEETELYEANLIDSAEYVTLNIRMNRSQDITIEYDNSKLILDKSNYLVSDLTVTNTSTISTFIIPNESLKNGENYEINFIKIISGSVIELETDIKIKTD